MAHSKVSFEKNVCKYKATLGDMQINGEIKFLFFICATLCTANNRPRFGLLSEVVKCSSQTLHRLVETLLDFATYHHSHHHIEFGVKHHSDTGVTLGNLLELNPEAEVDGDASLAGNNLNVLIINLFGNAQGDLHTLDLE